MSSSNVMLISILHHLLVKADEPAHTCSHTSAPALARPRRAHPCRQTQTDPPTDTLTHTDTHSHTPTHAHTSTYVCISGSRSVRDTTRVALQYEASEDRSSTEI